jgi:hypothetical protein
MKLQETFFSMPRFVNLCRKEMVENWKKYLLRVGLVYGAFAVILVWNGYFQYNHAEYARYDVVNSVQRFAMYTFIWLINIMGMVSASFMMERMKSKTGCISTLMTPATPFEQFFARWFILTFGYLIAFIIAYTLGDWTRVLIYRIVFPSVSELIQPVSLADIIRQLSVERLVKTSGEVWSIIAAYLFSQSLFVLGSSLWPRHSLVRTFVATIGVGIAYLLVGIGTFFLFVPADFNGSRINISDETGLIILNTFLYLMAVVNWTLAYYRFKESEIINRW